MAVAIRELIRRMHAANPLWGAPRIHGELLKLGLTVSQSTVAKYLGRCDGPSSQTWRIFFANHVAQLASIDFFTVPTATFRVLFVFVVLSHDRRRIVHLNVTEHPTTAWTAQQLREAWPWDTAPRFVIRDRDGIYGPELHHVTHAMDVEEVPTAPRSPWQNPFVERVIGSLRRECLDHIIVWNERALRRSLKQYLVYYHEWRTHLSLDKDAPFRGSSSRRPAARLFKSRTSAVCTITTNVAPPDRSSRRCRRRALRDVVRHPFSTRVRRRLRASSASGACHKPPAGDADRTRSDHFPHRSSFW